MSGTDRATRVLLIGPAPEERGGQAVQAQRLLSYLGRLPSLRVTFRPIRPVLPRWLQWTQQVKYLRTAVSETAYLGVLLGRIPRVDVVHVFSASYFAFLLAAAPPIILGRLLGKRVILNYRSGEADDHLSRWGWHAKPLLRLANVIVAPSAYLVEVFARHGLAARAIHNFVELDQIVHRPRPRPRPRFLANRNFHPLYNVECVIRAFAIIQDQLPEASLVLVGEGPERPALERLVRQLDLRQVRFAGSVPPERMGQVYDDADVYLNAPNIDNMPNSILEAFAAGLPIASTNAGGIPHILADGLEGLLVPVGNHEALAAAALRLVQEPGLAQRLTAAGRARVASQFTWESVREQWAALYAGVEPR